MASTKTTRTLATAVDLTGVSADAIIGSVATVNAGYGGILTVKLTNGATGPTTAPIFQIQMSHDNSAWWDFGGKISGSSTNSQIDSWSIDVPIGVQYVKLILKTVPSGGTANKPTCDSVMTEVTAV